jgi:hypothetical protein
MEKRFFKKYKSLNGSGNEAKSNHGSRLPTDKPNPKHTFLDLTNNLTKALVEWQRSGRPVVTSEQWNRRLAICRGCEYWSEIKKTQIAKCKKCGCSSGKLLLSTSKCPLNPPKWSAEV